VVTTRADEIDSERTSVDIDGVSYDVRLDETQKQRLRMGASVTAYAVDGGGVSLPVELSVRPHRVSLSEEGLGGVLAGDPVEGPDGEPVHPILTRGAVWALLQGGAVLTGGANREDGTTPLAIVPPQAEAQPLDERFDVYDLATFLADPWVPASDGTPIPVNLDAEQVVQLHMEGRGIVSAAGRTVQLTVVTERTAEDFQEFLELVDMVEPHDVIPMKPHGVHWPQIPKIPERWWHRPFVVVDSDDSFGKSSKVQPSGTGSPSMTDKVQSRLPSGNGLPVAVFVPWRQMWTLKGFSRGALLHTIALAPSEQVTMQVSSWERRTRSLDQSSETEVEQQTTVDQSTRDTDDVFKEMLAKRDFAWQLNGSVDASYSPGVASIKVHADGGVSDTSSIQQTARSSSQSVRESTIKASSRVRSRRVTRITQTAESGREERVTRVIRNPNQCHTLTLDFFETLAHYEIGLQFLKDHLRLVVLVPNPVRIQEFTSELARRNETALRNALIETALADGFDACRLVAAYNEARTIISAQKAEASQVDEPTNQRDHKPQDQLPDPAAAQEAEVLRILRNMVKALQDIRAGADVDAALTAIAKHAAVTETMRRAGQQWLFINFCGARFPALLAALDEIAKIGTADVAAAQRLLSVLPRPDAPTNLGNLNQMSDRDKEECTYSGKLREERNGKRWWMVSEWDWAWWSGRLKEEGLYTSNDGGLAGNADALVKAFQAWESKKAQGDAMKDQEVVRTEAEGKQDQASTEDKLAMAFPLDELAHAYERMKVLLAHLTDHKDFYNFALFQAFPPSEQALRIIEASDGRLQVGLFEPRAVATSGSRLVVPLTPLAGSKQLQEFVSSLGDDLAKAFKDALAKPDTTVIPTPGVTVSSRLGRCTGCEDFVEKSREYELARMDALAQQEALEAERRSKRIAAGKLEEFHPGTPALTVNVDHDTTVPPS
jgi:hypothetical protein